MQSKQIVDYITCLCDDEFVKAESILAALHGRPCLEKLKILKHKIWTAREILAKNQSKKIYQNQIQELQDRLKTLEENIAKQKTLQVYKSSSFNIQVAKKIEILHSLEIGKYEKVIELANDLKLIKMTNIAQELAQYRWLKLRLDGHQKQQKKLIEWSQNGRRLKEFLNNNLVFTENIRGYLQNALLSILSSEEVPINLPSSYFSEQFRINFQTINEMLRILKKMKIEEDQENIRKVKQAFQKIKIQDNQYLCFNDYFQMLLKKVVDSLHKLKELQELLHQNKKKFEQSQKNKDDQWAEFIKKIKDIALKSKVPKDGLNLEESNEEKQQLLLYFQRIIEKLKQGQQSLSVHKELLQLSTQKQRQNKIIKLNKQIEVKLSTIKNQNEANKSKDVFQLLEKNIQYLLIQFEKMRQAINKIIKTEKSQTIVQTQDFYQNMQVQPRQQPHHQNLQTICVSQYQEQIERLTRENIELAARNKKLSQQMQQQFKQKDGHIKTNKTLVSVIKDLENEIRSSIIIPQFQEGTDLAALQQKNNELLADNQRLKKLLQQKEMKEKLMIQKYNKKIRNLQDQKLEEVQRWQKRNNISQQQVQDLQNTLNKMNLMLEQKKQLEQSRRESQERIYEKSIQSISRSEIQQNLDSSEERYDNESHLVPLQDPTSNTLNNKIKQLQSIIYELRQLNLQKEKQYLESKIKEKNQMEEMYNQLRNEKIALEQRIRELQVRLNTQTPQNMRKMHLFPFGSIFQQTDNQERLFLIQNLENYVGPIKATKLLFRADPYNKTNFHKYIDRHKHIVLIFKTVFGKMIAGYSQQPFNPAGITIGHGMILSLWGRKVFTNRDKRAIGYDEYFVIFGNSELRIKTLEFKLFSNFGIANGFYETRGEKVSSILGIEKGREVEVSQYEFYALELENE